MGLDMYLTAKRFLGAGDVIKDKEAFNLAFGVPPEFQPQYISFEAAYWRKANHIHKWFVDNAQKGNDDCGDYYVSREALTTLRDLCQQVKDNHKLAEDLLPVQEGFFFGGGDYEEWYFEDIDATIEMIDKALEGFDESQFGFEYHSSW